MNEGAACRSVIIISLASLDARMKGFGVIVIIPVVMILELVVLLVLAGDYQAMASDDHGVYIVYMGTAAPANASLRHQQAQLLTSLLKRNRNAVVREYRYGFSGFAARLSAEEANSISNKPGVVSVFKDPLLQLHTTRSWDFLKYQNDLILNSHVHDMMITTTSAANSDSADTIIGILDTGIWPESLSFTDKDMGPIPSRWKGACMASHNFNSSNCNRKLIGARYYTSTDSSLDYQTVRDTMGHGTHVSSTAAGSPVQGASYYGLASGTAVGGSPGARIAMYRVCADEGCRGSSILAAYDDAIADGVDVLSLSLGASSFSKLDIKDDPIAIGGFHAVEQGITVVCSAGNDGPDAGTVVNAAPWLLTVAANTIDRYFESDVVLGDKKVIKGGGMHFGDLGKSPVLPIIYAKSAKISDDKEKNARNCGQGSMKKEMIKGRIVVCENDDAEEYSTYEKISEVKKLGGIGLVLIDDKSTDLFTSSYGTFPMTAVTKKDAIQILQYINSTSNPVATILPTVTMTDYKPAPVIAYFSSRGPSSLSTNILKPDISAPGVSILAAWIANDTSEAVEGKDPPLFNIISGTSMSCPHVSGVAAAVKSRYPTWSPAAVRSAIMTTASQSNNDKSPITTEKNSAATGYDMGAGELSTTGPLQPGLIYETTIVDYLNFLCHYGYNTTTLKIIAKTIPQDFSCPTHTTPDLISDMNYPSIAISALNQTRKVNRTVINVAEDGETEYTVSIDAPASVDVQVVPDKLEFKSNGQKLSYQVVFSPKQEINKDVFGAITWSNAKFKVRSPFVITT